MDKQDAIDFIVEAFEQGQSPSEIARDLSREMNAPYDIVAGFVNRTLEKRIALLGSIPPASEPALPVDGPSQTAPAIDWSAPSPGWTPPGAGWDAYTTGIDKPEDAGETLPQEPVGAEGVLAMPLEAGMGEALPDPAPAPVAVLLTETPVTPVPSPSTKPRETDPKLEKFILDALGSNKKHSDIVMAVCERAGLDWPEAQRLVGRVETMNRKQVAARRNRMLIPLSIIAILIGLALTAAGLEQFAAYQAVFQGLVDEGAQGVIDAGLPEDAYRPDYLIGYILTGLALAVGGGVGLFKSLKAQLE
jgi:hypothetical protein